MKGTPTEMQGEIITAGDMDARDPYWGHQGAADRLSNLTQVPKPAKGMKVPRTNVTRKTFFKDLQDVGR